MNLGDTVTDGTAVFKLRTKSNPGLIGRVEWFAGNYTPSGYLVCDGSAVSRTNYAELFKVIGTYFGSGDGSTTFNLPNIINRFIEGQKTPGLTAGSGLPNISGYFDVRPTCVEDSKSLSGAFYSTTIVSQESAGYTGGGDYGKQGNRKYYFSAAKSNSIYGSSSMVQPPAVSLRPIIKYI